MTDKFIPDKRRKRVDALEQSDYIRKQSDENLKLFKKVVDSATDAIGISTPEGHHWYQNAAFDDQFGNIGEDPPATVFCNQNVGREVFKTTMSGEEWSGEVQMYAADGRILDILLRTYAFTDETGRVLGLVGVHTDITASKRTQELFKLVAQSTNDVFYEWNVQTDSLQWFSDISAELGYAPGEVSPTINGWIELIHPDDRPQLEDAVMKHRTETQDIDYLYRVKHKNGTWRYWHDHARPILDRDNLPVRWVGGISDITERKMAEETLATKASLEKIISQASRRFLTLTELDKSINACLADIGRFCAAGRAYLFQFTSDGATMNNTHEWCAPGVKPEIDNLKGLPLEMFPWWMKLLEAGKNIHVKSVAEMPTEARAEREILEAQNIKSVLVVPLLVENKLSGFMGLDNVDSTRTWDQKELIPLRTLAEIIGTALTRKRAIEALRQSEARFRELADMLPQIVFETDIKGNLTYVNNNAFNTFGYANDEFLSGLNAMQMIAPKDRDRAAERIRQILRGSSHLIGSEYRAKKKDGTEFPVIVYSTVIISEGKPVGLRGIMIDITDRKRAEKVLQESERKWRKILIETPQIGISLDRQARIIFANKRFLELTGWQEDEILYHNWFDLFIPKDVREEVRAVFDKVMHAKNAMGYSTNENEILTKSGERLNVAWSNVLTKDPNGAVVDVTCLGIDLTSRKLAEKEREQLQAQLIQAQKMEAIGTLAGGIAHNFNNILMGVQGRTSLMMLDKDLSDPDYEHLKGIQASVKNAVELTSELLGFARGGKYEVKPVDLNSLIRHENMIFAQTRKEIRIHGKYEKDLWTVEVDQGQMRQVLLNLYVNAWQAMPDGGDLETKTENVTLDEKQTKPFQIAPGRYVKISVTDTGVGMNDVARKKVFEPFFTTRDVGQGSGLGLASAYGIIKNHGGIINVYSKKGEGTTFTIYLPALKKRVAQDATGADRQGIQYGQGTVLLVDDEENILNVERKILEKLGYRVVTAGSGLEAVDAYLKQKENIILVILDMVMPGMGGGETFDRLKAIDRDVKVILSSGYSIDGRATDIMDRGCVGFIQKPFTVEEISWKVRKALDARE